jgi:alcohol dehydrogenase
MQAYNYVLLLDMIKSGKLSPQKLIGKSISLEDAAVELPDMNSFHGVGITMITEL